MLSGMKRTMTSRRFEHRQPLAATHKTDDHVERRAPAGNLVVATTRRGSP